MDETLEDRLAALERALADDGHDFEALATDGAVADRVQAVESDVETLTDRVAELEAATQALRGYVGNVRAVNEETRERADLAMETAERARAEATDSDTAHRRATGSPTDRPNDEQAADDTEREPTLELAADQPDTHETRHGQSTDRCPVCDDTTARSRRKGRLGDGGQSEPSDRLQGLTDGGRVQTDGSTADNPGLLARIRALL